MAGPLLFALNRQKGVRSMSKKRSVQVNIKFVKSPDASRRMVQLAQLIARSQNNASGKGNIDEKEK